mgnify:FL=1
MRAQLVVAAVVLQREVKRGRFLGYVAGWKEGIQNYFGRRGFGDSAGVGV